MGNQNLAQNAPTALIEESCALLEKVIGLKQERAALREQVDQLLDILARVAVENFVLSRVVEREMLMRINTEGQLARERQRRYSHQKAAA